MIRKTKVILLLSGVIIAGIMMSGALLQQRVPITWDRDAIHNFHLPPPDTSVKISFASKAYYDSLPEHIIYKTYPVYVRESEPKGYLDSLRTLSPEIAMDESEIKTEEDWIKSGELVFNWPVAYSPADGNVSTIIKATLSPSRTKLLPNDVSGFSRYVILEKGKVVTGSLSCASCHTHVLNSGEVVAGGQGNTISTAGLIDAILAERIPFPLFKAGTKSLSYAPWAPQIKSEPETKEEGAAYFSAMRLGISDRQGGGYLYPLSIPSLIGIKDIRYLDHTGLMKHDGPGDIMRYAAFNQGMDMLTSYNDYIPGISEKKLSTSTKWRHPFGYARKKYSDVQLYALTKYLYSLIAPVNPTKYSKQMLNTGKMIFAREGCVSCHAPPLYTNNKLTPASGFTPRANERLRDDIFDVSVQTDSVTTLYTRRGTGYYKVPSLRGVWFRDAFFHNGNLATLDEVLDPRRLRADYIPGGYMPPGVKSMAVKGHPFGLSISNNEKKALIAFLKTL